MMRGLTSSATLKRHSQKDDGYGGVSTVASTLLSSWKCRISRMSGSMAQKEFGQISSKMYTISGENTDFDIREGDTVECGGVTYEVLRAVSQEDEIGDRDHWLLLCEVK